MSATKKPPKTQADYAAALLEGEGFTSDDVATLPRPGSNTPSSIKYSADGGVLMYLQAEGGGSLSRQLLATDVATGETVELMQPDGAGREEDFSLEEKLRRERLRMMATGVTSFLTAPEASKALVPLGGALWLLDVPSAGGAIGDSPAPVKVAETNANEAAAAEGDGFDALPAGAPLLDAKLSADGSTVAFVCGEEVYAVVATAGPGATPKRLTSGARGVDGLSNGVADCE
jgi:dipeptidyl-peptidase-4